MVPVPFLCCARSFTVLHWCGESAWVLLKMCSNMHTMPLKYSLFLGLQWRSPDTHPVGTSIIFYWLNDSMHSTCSNLCTKLEQLIGLETGKLYSTFFYISPLTQKYSLWGTYALRKIISWLNSTGYSRYYSCFALNKLLSWFCYRWSWRHKTRGTFVKAAIYTCILTYLTLVSNHMVDATIQLQHSIQNGIKWHASWFYLQSCSYSRSAKHHEDDIVICRWERQEGKKIFTTYSSLPQHFKIPSAKGIIKHWC